VRFSREYDLDNQGRFSDTPTTERASRPEARFRYDDAAHGKLKE
jgi:hypothetical protein